MVLQQNDETLQECIRRIQDLSVCKLCCKATASQLVGSRVWRVIFFLAFAFINVNYVTLQLPYMRKDHAAMTGHASATVYVYM